ncbi:hypothetical protein [Gordonia crocea]|uniref:2-isopropylmalate synthase LeuA allosteric (dimerisation) domain-containing protein n=1 Tax=Gordonia crocea TaxID=589162 RepID=A0A7M3SVE5_9ACTN|nr:hypothetical protein [Gordonia crocea]GED96619.1 hypothetical protein nbrc107697_06580 [Gordonia crocea]
MHTSNLTPAFFSRTADLPSGLREEAHALSTEELTERSSPAERGIRLHSWATSPADGDRLACRATIVVDNHDHRVEARATGQLGALTAMLYDVGAGVEIHRFHQRREGDEFITILLCGNDYDEWWAVGSGADGDEASRNALIAGANLLPR